MFTGIVSYSTPILRVQKRNSVLEITLSACLSGVQPGDSVAVDGVCLTVEKIDSSEMIFALAPDTLKTTGWGLADLEKKKVNLEPSLKVDSSLGGHFVTGHVDGMAEVQKIQTSDTSSPQSSQSSQSPQSPQSSQSSQSPSSLHSPSSLRKQGTSTPETANLVLKLPLEFKPFLWKKGYLTVNGVSLTIQEVLGESLVRLGLVPETLKRTNLSELKAGNLVTFEVCYLARAVFHQSPLKM